LFIRTVNKENIRAKCMPKRTTMVIVDRYRDTLWKEVMRAKKDGKLI